MRTTFRRQFSTIAALLLLCLIVTGVSFLLLMLNSLRETTQKTLQTDAKAVAALSEAYEAIDELEHNWDFRMSLSMLSAVGESQIFICDEAGIVRVCSCEDITCAHIGQTLPAKVSQALASGEAYGAGVLDNLYEKRCFYTAVPIGTQNAGIVLACAPMTQTDDFMRRSSGLFLLTAVAVLLLALLAATFLSRTQTKPLQKVADAARRFGRGELDARVHVSRHSTQEIRDLATAFNTMADSLEQLERGRQEFIANVSHELKTPMTTIGGFIDGILDGTIPAEKQPQYMQRVSNEVRRLSRLVRNMLDISRLQTQGVDAAKKVRFDISESVSDVLVAFEQKITAKQLQVSVQLPDKAMFTRAERDSITQVLYNLVDNAVKFSPQGGLLHVEAKPDGGKARISVRNTGPTIAPDQLPRIFDRFHKEDKSRSQDREGWGLGLYIARTIILAHGEQIFADSRDGVTTFSFTLPLVR